MIIKFVLSFNRRKTKHKKTVIHKNYIKIARFPQSVITFSLRFGLPLTAVRRFNVPSASVYCWRSRFNGETQALQYKSRRPHLHPN